MVPVPEIDTTVACQSSYTKVFASGGSFQDESGELKFVGAQLWNDICLEYIDSIYIKFSILIVLQYLGNFGFYVHRNH